METPDSRQSFKITSLYLTALLLLTHTATACLSLHGEEREVLDAREILNSENNIASCLRDSLAKGNIGMARSIVQQYDSQHVQAMVRVLEDELLRLKQLQAEIIQSQTAYQPVAKWGQNETHIFVSLKLSHRWDSPPCLNTKYQSTSSSETYLNYTNICLVSNSKITFSFLLYFYQPVSNATICLSNDGVGTYSTIIQKKEDTIWPYLGNDERIYPIWTEISERHNSVYKQYQNLINSIIRARKAKPVIFEEKNENTENGTANNQIQEQKGHQIQLQDASQEAQKQQFFQTVQQSTQEDPQNISSSQDQVSIPSFLSSSNTDQKK